MEKTLKRLFDFQKFLADTHLAEIIADTESRYGNVLSDHDLEAVNAAGELIPPRIREDCADE